MKRTQWTFAKKTQKISKQISGAFGARPLFYFSGPPHPPGGGSLSENQSVALEKPVSHPPGGGVGQVRGNGSNSFLERTSPKKPKQTSPREPSQRSSIFPKKKVPADMFRAVWGRAANERCFHIVPWKTHTTWGVGHEHIGRAGDDVVVWDWVLTLAGRLLSGLSNFQGVFSFWSDSKWQKIPVQYAKYSTELIKKSQEKRTIPHPHH